MKDKLKESPPADKAGDSPAKRPYATPELRVYGSVAALTQSGGFSRATDGRRASRRPSFPSDPRLKENIVRIGTHPTVGVGLFLFDYRPEYREQYGQGRQFGVMADEVEAVMPAAVSLHIDGYKRVDYAMLGVYPSATH